MLELQIKDLCVGYIGKEILHNISLDIENGSFIAIVGPSGAGKSTLLKQINRLDPGMDFFEINVEKISNFR